MSVVTGFVAGVVLGLIVIVLTAALVGYRMQKREKSRVAETPDEDPRVEQ